MRQTGRRTPPSDWTSPAVTIEAPSCALVRNTEVILAQALARPIRRTEVRILMMLIRLRWHGTEPHAAIATYRRRVRQATTLPRCEAASIGPTRAVAAASGRFSAVA